MSQSPNPDQISAWIVELPLIRPFSTAATSLRHRRVIVLRLRRGDLEGWGEADPVPGHSMETTDTLWKWLTDSATTVGMSMDPPRSGMLAAAFSQAEADIAARTAEEPLWRHLGGSSPVWASAAIGLNSDHQPDLIQVHEAASQGYRRMKLKIDQHTRAADLATVVAEHPEVSFGADANGALDLTASTHLSELDVLGLSYLEQPGAIDDHSGHRRLRSILETPIALDETASSEATIARILAEDSADIINLKAGRFGTKRTLQLATDIGATGRRVRLGGLIESGIGRAHSVALATHDVFADGGDIAASDRYFADDLVRPQWRLVDGRLDPTNGPGIGVAVDETAVNRFAVDSLTVD